MSIFLIPIMTSVPAIERIFGGGGGGTQKFRENRRTATSFLSVATFCGWCCTEAALEPARTDGVCVDDGATLLIC